jgi:hypothetical protein
MVAALATVLALVVLVHSSSAGRGPLGAALRVTARRSFIWFWLASVDLARVKWHLRNGLTLFAGDLTVDRTEISLDPQQSAILGANSLTRV